MSRNVAILAAVLLLAIIAAGIWTVGGPGTARLDRQDEERLDNLMTLENHVLCYARSHDGQLPDKLEGITGCVADPPLSDPFTKAAYVYTVNPDGSFALCAVFNNLARSASWAENRAYSNFDHAAGCIVSRYKG